MLSLLYLLYTFDRERESAGDNNFISDLIKDVLRDLHAFSGGLFILIKISIM